MGIYIGLAGWGDQDYIYPAGTKQGERLNVYSSHFPVVEVDSTFYAIQSPERFAGWVEQTPPDFKFVVKAYQGMTGHQRGPEPSKQETEEMATAFRAMLQPAIEAGKLAAALFQYPPWFQCVSGNVRQLREMKSRMSNIPCALEFRHQSWFRDEMREKTLAFMSEEGWIHSICDEPQAGEGSIPTVLKTSNSDLAVVRFHGRNHSGWNNGGAPNWREVRYLYCYSEEELLDWRNKLVDLQEQCRNIHVIFNNNSGGDAAGNAKRLMELLELKRPDGLAPFAKPPEGPEQLELF
ncbi:DUF72 domain-containing protein [Paenibacillus sp. CAU 1782]